MYRNLDPDKTLETLEILLNRITARFPNSGLKTVCQELCQLCEEVKSKADKIKRPNYSVRFGIIFLIVLTVASLIYSVSLLKIQAKAFTIGEFIQVTEAGFNTLVLTVGALFFLITSETRVKRSRSLAALHEVRSIAHVIDMHQLTKDPSSSSIKIIDPKHGNTRHHDLSSFELLRYLNYCSEMLSLTGKVAALFAQNFKDPVVLATVTEIENLASGLSRKIWQKIMILHKLYEDELEQAQKEQRST